MNKRNIAIIGVAAVIVIAAGIFMLQKKSDVAIEKKQDTQEQNKQQPTAQGNNQVIADLSDWATYKNDEYGFEVKYPKDWKFRTIINPSSKADLYFFEKDEYNYLGVFPRGGYGHGVAEPKIKYNKFKGKEAKMFWYDESYPKYLMIIDEKLPKNWDKKNAIEFIGSEENDDILNKIYDDFKFIEE